MKHVTILVAILLMALATTIHAVCEPMTDAQKERLRNIVGDTWDASVYIDTGVLCDSGLYYTAADRYADRKLCEYRNVKTNRQVSISTTYGKRDKLIRQYDELQMVTSEQTEENTEMSCIELYQMFKKDLVAEENGGSQR